MGSEADFSEPYKAALWGDWEPFKKFYEEHVRLMSFPVTASKDNAFHLAAFSEKKGLLQSLLEISEKDPFSRYGYLEKNSYGNTALHEAAVNEDLEAAEALVNHHSKLLKEDNITGQKEDELLVDLLEDKNIVGETPLFTAASFGSLEVLKFLAKKSSIKKTRFIEKEGDRKNKEYYPLKDIHIGFPNAEPKPDASNQLSGVIQGEIILKPKPKVSYRLSGTIPGEIILELKPDASNELSSVIHGEIKLDFKPDVSTQLSSVIQGEMKLKPKPDDSTQLSSVLQGEIKLEPKPDASTQLSSVIKGEMKLEPNPDVSTQLSGVIRGKIISKPKSGATDASILHAAITRQKFETALYLLKKDESLAKLKDRNGQTSLQLLATMPTAFKSGHQWRSRIHKVFYYCLSLGPIDIDVDDEKDTSINAKGLLSSDNENATSCFIACSSSSTCSKISEVLGKICELASNTMKEKREHKLALKLADRLLEIDSSWEETINRQAAPVSQFGEEEDRKSNPLFLATEKGIVEIVHKILEEWPQLADHQNDQDENILHVAIKHHQDDIFNYVINMKIRKTRLVRQIDKNGYTILHHAADMDPRSDKINPKGPVYQLQDELRWFTRVRDIMPKQYPMLRDTKEGFTCEELFNSKHKNLLENAKEQIKKTSESCSTVAILVATVVFAAAYTLPGGSNEKGYPIFVNNSLFSVFTIMDVIALATSLTSVVMFLSILTSPYTYKEFQDELPRKLTIGFSLLFISLTTTMIAFATTLLLVVRSEKPQWTTTLIYTAAFFPVSIFALTNFPMYSVFARTLLKLYQCIKKPASRQGSIAKQAAPENRIAHRAGSNV